jgi:broad specificity phosphatase PhoE
MLLYLVRHGQSVWNAEGRHQGWQDVPLSPLGQQQAERIAQRLKGQKFDYMFTSPIKRCYDTAAAIVRAQERPLDDLVVREGLREARLSAELEGLAEKEILKRWTKEQKQLFREDYSFKFPDGESVKEVMARTVEEFKAIAALSEEAPPDPEEEQESEAPADTTHPDGEAQPAPESGQVATGRDGEREKPKVPQKTALIVSHRINVQLFTLYALDALDSIARRQNNIDRLEISNCALSVIETNLKGKQPHFRVLTVNDITHLARLTPPKPSAEEPSK